MSMLCEDPSLTFGLLPSSSASELLHSAFCILHFPFLAVTSPLPSASPAGDIRAIVPPQPYFLSGGVFWLIVAAVSLVLAGLVAWYLLRRPKKPKPAGPTISPREAARQRLAELARRADELDAREFGGEVCDVLRAYITDEYGLQPQRQTSPEFLAAVSSSRVFSSDEHRLLSEFLEGCDLLKFARADATPDGKRALLEQASEFLEGSRQELPPSLPPLMPPVPPGSLPLPLPPPLLTTTAETGDRRWQPPETTLPQR